MCRNIKKQQQLEITASEEEIRLAALQFVRKVSGYRRPSKRHQPAFERAVDEVAAATLKLLLELKSH